MATSARPTPVRTRPARHGLALMYCAQWKPTMKTQPIRSRFEMRSASHGSPTKRNGNTAGSVGTNTRQKMTKAPIGSSRVTPVRNGPICQEDMDAAVESLAVLRPRYRLELRIQFMPDRGQGRVLARCGADGAKEAGAAPANKGVGHDVEDCV